MSIRLVAIGEVCGDVRTWNPTRFPDDEFRYIDLSSVDQSHKLITGATTLLGSTAPSRARQLITAGDVLISTVRPNLNGVAPVTAKFDGATASTGFCVLRPCPDKLDSAYLMHWVRSQMFVDAMVREATGASYPAVSDRIIKNSSIPLPPLPEQRRIAAILDKADALRRKRKRAIELLDSLTQSIFLEMFGDLSSNSREWPTSKVGELCKRICVGIVVTPAAYYQQSGIPALRSLNIDIDAFKLADLVFVSAEDNESKLKKSKLSRGDVVIVRTGQPGKAAVVTPDLDGVNAIDLLIASPNRARLEPQFLSSLMNSEIGRRLVLSEKRGQIQQHLNVGSLKSAIIPVPPLAEQKRFVAVWDQLRRSMVTARTAGAEVDNLFASLQFRAFSGQL